MYSADGTTLHGIASAGNDNVFWRDGLLKRKVFVRAPRPESAFSPSSTYCSSFKYNTSPTAE